MDNSCSTHGMFLPAFAGIVLIESSEMHVSKVLPSRTLRGGLYRLHPVSEQSSATGSFKEVTFGARALCQTPRNCLFAAVCAAGAATRAQRGVLRRGTGIKSMKVKPLG